MGYLLLLIGCEKRLEMKEMKYCGNKECEREEPRDLAEYCPSCGTNELYDSKIGRAFSKPVKVVERFGQNWQARQRSRKIDRKSEQEQFLANHLTDLVTVWGNVRLTFAQDICIIGGEELERVFRKAAQRADFDYETNFRMAETPQTGRGYGSFKPIRVSNEKKTVVVTGLHQGDSFVYHQGVGIYAPAYRQGSNVRGVRGGDIQIRPTFSSISGIGNSDLRKFVARFYEVLQGEGR